MEGTTFNCLIEALREEIHKLKWFITQQEKTIKEQALQIIKLEKQLKGIKDKAKQCTLKLR